MERQSCEGSLSKGCLSALRLNRLWCNIVYIESYMIYKDLTFSVKRGLTKVT